MKNFYIAVTVEENEKYYSYVIKVSESDNLLCKLKIPNIVNATIFPTKKKAAEVVTLWNDSYKTNGTYYFDEPLF